jgi:hypothetical protein
MTVKEWVEKVKANMAARQAARQANRAARREAKLSMLSDPVAYQEYRTKLLAAAKKSGLTEAQAEAICLTYDDYRDIVLAIQAADGLNPMIKLDITEAVLDAFERFAGMFNVTLAAIAAIKDADLNAQV